jgi:DNA repair protein SbcC/Rad50
VKILNLFFKNINSLEGENRINFDQPPFSDTGVFAITGANGSGKSSILDAITLALYGETFRFEKPAQYVMTKHTTECFSTLEFCIGPDKYCSSWRVQRVIDNLDGHLLPTEMKLIRLDDRENPLAQTPYDVCEKITQITGMNFRSFTRSILLAQGDFSAFLNALDNERMDILEKIIGKEIYDNIKKEVTEKLFEAQKNLNFLHEDLTAVPIITPDSLAACENDLQDFKEQSDSYNYEISNLQDELISLRETATVSEQINTLEYQLQNVINQRIAVQKKLDLLANSDKAFEFKAEIAVNNEYKKLLAEAVENLTALQNEKKQLEYTLNLPDYAADNSEIKQRFEQIDENDFNTQKLIIDNLHNQISIFNANWQSEIILQKSLVEQITSKQTELLDVSGWITEHSKDELLLENFPEFNRLKNLRIAAKELADKKITINNWSQSNSTALEKNKRGILVKSDYLAKLNRKVALAEQDLYKIAQDHTFEEILDFQAEQKDRVKNIQELVNLASSYEKLLPKRPFFNRLFGKPIESVRHADELEQELEQLKEQFKREENIRISLERVVFNDSLIARMAHDRSHLIDGKPCPLCGANDHPFAKFPPIPINSQQALNDQRIKIKRLTIKIKEMEDLLVFSRKRAEKNIVNSARLEEIKGRWLSLCNKLNIAAEEFDILKVGAVKRYLKHESTELKNITVLLTKYKNTQKKINKIKGTIAKTDETILKLQSSMKTIETEWQLEPSLVAEHESESAKLSNEEQELIEVISGILRTLNEKLPPMGKEDELIEKLELRSKEYKAYYEREQSLKSELELLTAKQALGQTQINLYKDRLTEFSGQLRIEETVGLQLALIEKQKLIAEKEKQVNQLKTEAKNAETAFASKLEGSIFTGLEEIVAILSLLELKPELNNQKLALDKSVETMSRELDKLAIRLETNLANVKPGFSIEEQEQSIKSAQEKMDIAELEKQRLETIIREQKQLGQKYDGILAQISKQEAFVASAAEDVAALSADHGLVLRRRVQGIMVEKLLSKTNEILEKISGRYYLRQIDSERGLALEIEDTYQGNVRRIPKTLSGGESFIVSLALALGLSELASQGRSIDSLFLDEGFGALDAETLFTVINTLEGLRAHGKLVGVISHVEAVQKRFKAQLQLIKKPNGLGELRKVS